MCEAVANAIYSRNYANTLIASFYRRGFCDEISTNGERTLREVHRKIGVRVLEKSGASNSSKARLSECRCDSVERTVNLKYEVGVVRKVRARRIKNGGTPAYHDGRHSVRL